MPPGAGIKVVDHHCLASPKGFRTVLFEFSVKERFFFLFQKLPSEIKKRPRIWGGVFPREASFSSGGGRRFEMIWSPGEPLRESGKWVPTRHLGSVSFAFGPRYDCSE